MKRLFASSAEAEAMGVQLLEAPVHADARGYLWELTSAGRPGFEIRQTNHSWSAEEGTLRGLHFQRPPAAQAKLVSVVAGVIWDVAVDVRRGSPTFGQWCAARLEAGTGRSMLIPEGFAHGFLTMEPSTHVVYHLSAPYSPDSEGGIRWDDASLAIPWPASPKVIGDRDRELPPLHDVEAVG